MLRVSVIRIRRYFLTPSRDFDALCSFTSYLQPSLLKLWEMLTRCLLVHLPPRPRFPVQHYILGSDRTVEDLQLRCNVSAHAVFPTHRCCVTSAVLPCGEAIPESQVVETCAHTPRYVCDGGHPSSYCYKLLPLGYGWAVLQLVCLSALERVVAEVQLPIISWAGYRNCPLHLPPLFLFLLSRC